VPELRLPKTAIRFVFPHAPVRPVTINGGMRMRACTTSRRRETRAKKSARARLAGIHRNPDRQGKRARREGGPLCWRILAGRAIAAAHRFAPS